MAKPSRPVVLPILGKSRTAPLGREHPALRRNRSRASHPAQTRLSGRRHCIECADTIGQDAKTLLDEAEAKVFEIAEAGARSTGGFVPIQPILGQVVDRIQELYDRDNPSQITGIPTGLVDLDAKTSGLQATDMIIVAGRPGMGKTTLALNIAEHVAIEAHLPVAIFSMEMPERSWRCVSLPRWGGSTSIGSGPVSSMTTNGSASHTHSESFTTRRFTLTKRQA